MLLALDQRLFHGHCSGSRDTRHPRFSRGSGQQSLTLPLGPHYHISALTPTDLPQSRLLCVQSTVLSSFARHCIFGGAGFCAETDISPRSGTRASGLLHPTSWRQTTSSPSAPGPTQPQGHLPVKLSGSKGLTFPGLASCSPWSRANGEPQFLCDLQFPLLKEQRSEVTLGFV